MNTGADEKRHCVNYLLPSWGRFCAFCLAVFLISFLISCAGSSSNPPMSEALRQDAGSVIEVLGAANDLDYEGWKDQRIGKGLRILLTEELQQTGKFRFTQPDSSMQVRRQEIAAGIWAGLYKGDEWDGLLAESQADFQAWAKVIYFGRPRSGMSVGVMHKQTQSTIVRLELFLHEKTSGKEWKWLGEGETETTASSVVFSFDEDQATLDQGAAGIALRRALKDAVDKFRADLQAP